MNHTCKNCDNVFPIVGETRSAKAWGLGIKGIYTTDFATAIDEYEIVICPKCGHREKHDGLKIFGIFTPSQFKVVVIIVLAVLALGGIAGLLF